MRFPYAIAPATILGPLPKMVHKIVFTWKFYVFTLMDLLGKKGPRTPSKNFPHIFIAKLVRLTRFIYALAPSSTLGRLLAEKPSTTKCSK